MKNGDEMRLAHSTAPTSVDIRQRKFRLTLGILAAGFAVAAAWYSYQNYLGRVYPYNTYLFLPNARFSDFTDSYRAALNPQPYLVPCAAYPPVAYVLLRPLQWFSMPIPFFFLLGIVPIFFLLRNALRPIFSDFLQGFLGNRFPVDDPERGGINRLLHGLLGLVLVVLLLGFCEPFVVLLDRGNNEIWIIPMVAAAIACFSRARFYASAAWLVLPICMKMYPAFLLVLFLRRNKLRVIVLAVAASAAVTAASYACFTGGIVESFLLNKASLQTATETYLIGSWGLTETASPWNVYRILAITVHAVNTGHFHDAIWNWQDLTPQFRLALPIYSHCVLVVGAGVAAYCVLIEKEVLRRVVIALLFMVLASPAGSEHKMVHIGTALVSLILIRTFRSGDLLVTVLLALALIPKKAGILECFGTTDTQFADVSSAIILNPLLMLTALAVLLGSGIANADLNWTRLRFQGLCRLSKRGRA